MASINAQSPRALPDPSSIASAPPPVSPKLAEPKTSGTVNTRDEFSSAGDNPTKKTTRSGLKLADPKNKGGAAKTNQAQAKPSKLASQLQGKAMDSLGHKLSELAETNPSKAGDLYAKQLNLQSGEKQGVKLAELMVTVQTLGPSTAEAKELVNEVFTQLGGGDANSGATRFAEMVAEQPIASSFWILDASKATTVSSKDYGELKGTGVVSGIDAIMEAAATDEVRGSIQKSLDSAGEQAFGWDVSDYSQVDAYGSTENDFTRCFAQSTVAHVLRKGPQETKAYASRLTKMLTDVASGSPGSDAGKIVANEGRLGKQDVAELAARANKVAAADPLSKADVQWLAAITLDLVSPGTDFTTDGSDANFGTIMTNSAEQLFEALLGAEEVRGAPRELNLLDTSSITKALPHMEGGRSVLVLAMHSVGKHSLASSGANRETGHGLNVQVTENEDGSFVTLFDPSRTGDNELLLYEVVDGEILPGPDYEVGMAHVKTFNLDGDTGKFAVQFALPAGP